VVGAYPIKFEHATQVFCTGGRAILIQRLRPYNPRSGRWPLRYGGNAVRIPTVVPAADFTI
jgi:hypothetical protein